MILNQFSRAARTRERVAHSVLKSNLEAIWAVKITE